MRVKKKLCSRSDSLVSLRLSVKVSLTPLVQSYWQFRAQWIHFISQKERQSPGKSRWSPEQDYRDCGLGGVSGLVWTTRQIRRDKDWSLLNNTPGLFSIHKLIWLRTRKLWVICRKRKLVFCFLLLQISHSIFKTT